MENPNTRIEKISAIIFLIVGTLEVLEYIFIQGLFSAPIVILASVIVGIVNIIVAIISKKYINMLFYALLTIALNMGYMLIIGY
ncbi:MAG: hypothetical protein PHS74_12305 [Lachnospiraceae bacterium]|nr:hypothetical protein [Lachnospiraceae bacterium]